MRYSCEWAIGYKVSKCHALSMKDSPVTACGLSFAGKVWRRIYAGGRITCAKCARKVAP